MPLTVSHFSLVSPFLCLAPLSPVSRLVRYIYPSSLPGFCPILAMLKCWFSEKHYLEQTEEGSELELTPKKVIQWRFFGSPNFILVPLWEAPNRIFSANKDPKREETLIFFGWLSLWTTSWEPWGPNWWAEPAEMQIAPLTGNQNCWNKYLNKTQEWEGFPWIENTISLFCSQNTLTHLSWCFWFQKQTSCLVSWGCASSPPLPGTLPCYFHFIFQQ